MSDVAPTAGWCTDWSAYNTPRLWAMVSEEDDPDAWRQVAAWADVAGAVRDHRARLLRAREALVAAWPPEQNMAADAFVSELDELLTRMDRAREAADTTATGLSHILEALRQAKEEIRPLYEEYRAKSDDWVPNWWDEAEDEIDSRAQARMVAAEQVVQQHVPQLRVPPPYRLDPMGRGGFEPSPRTPSGGGAVAVPHDPVPPLPGRSPSVPEGAGGAAAGVDLASVAPSPVPPPAGVGLVAAPGSPVPGVIGGPVPAVLPGVPGSGVPSGAGRPGAVPPGGPARGIGVPRGGGVLPPGAGGHGPGRPAAGGLRGALPSGAVIGETFGGRGTVAGPAGPGGMPGGYASGTGRAGGGMPGGYAAGSGRAGTPGGPAAGSGRSGAQGAAKPKPPAWLPDDPPPARGAGMSPAARRDTTDTVWHFDPDNPWEVSGGVAPVIAPLADSPTHDPGPNVLGHRW